MVKDKQYNYVYTYTKGNSNMVGRYSTDWRLTGDGLSFSLSVFLRRLFFLPAREEEEEEGAMDGLDGFSVGFFVSAAIDSGLASNCRTIHGVQSHIEVHNNKGLVSAAIDSGLASNCRTIHGVQSHIEVHNNKGLVSAAIDSGLASNCRTIQSHIEVHNNKGCSASQFTNVSSRISWTCTHCRCIQQ